MAVRVLVIVIRARYNHERWGPPEALRNPRDCPYWMPHPARPSIVPWCRLDSGGRAAAWVDPGPWPS